MSPEVFWSQRQRSWRRAIARPRSSRRLVDGSWRSPRCCDLEEKPGATGGTGGAASDGKPPGKHRKNGGKMWKITIL